MRTSGWIKAIATYELNRRHMPDSNLYVRFDRITTIIRFGYVMHDRAPYTATSDLCSIYPVWVELPYTRNIYPNELLCPFSTVLRLTFTNSLIRFGSQSN